MKLIVKTEEYLIVNYSRDQLVVVFGELIFQVFNDRITQFYYFVCTDFTICYVQAKNLRS